MTQVIPQTRPLSDDEAQLLSYLDKATTLFREKASRSPEEVQAFNSHLDQVRRSFIFRDVQPRLHDQVFLCMPHAGSVEHEAVASMYMAAGPGSSFGVIASNKLCSSTPHAFNQGWCDAVNGRNADGTRTFQWFCMVHSDVMPFTSDKSDPRPWLQVLVEEAEKSEWDVLHAVVAIKDQRGLTSTAIGLKGFEYQYAKCRRIATTELQQLPETFDHRMYLEQMGVDGWNQVFRDAGVQGHGASPEGREAILSQTCMLNNTGVMLVRLTPKMRKFTGFRFQNKLVAWGDFDGNGNRDWELDDPVVLALDRESRDYPILPRFTPEDWDFGRWCANAELRVAATRKVAVRHIGRGIYGSDVAWGTEQRDEWFFTKE